MPEGGLLIPSPPAAPGPLRALPSPVWTAGRPAAILSVATELPAGRFPNAELSERLGVSEEWIMSRTGIRERRRAEPHERLSDYATEWGQAGRG